MAEEKSGAFEERFNNVKAVVAGAAGKTGQAITRQLLQAPNAQVKGLVRDTEAAVRHSHLYCRIVLQIVLTDEEGGFEFAHLLLLSRRYQR